MQDLAFRHFIERVKLLAPVERVVSERVPELTRRGALHWARCPFHEERTPSFAVDPRKGTWRCYGACAEGGDAISFVERFDGLEFLDALRVLARSVGEELPELARKRRSPDADAREERLREVLERATRHYQRALESDEGREARAYLAGRGLSAETVRTFRLGWAPAGRRALLEAARGAGVDPADLVEVGLAKRGESGDLFDFFRGRLVIPITDRVGRVLGFGARVLGGEESGPKYLNTPETGLFHKGRLIYGLAEAADDVRRTHAIVLVEGYTDVQAAHQVGVRNVAAVLGTATTREHAALIRRSGARRCVLVFDGDEAGRAASRRALAELLPIGLELLVASPPAGADPCDLCLGAGDPEAGRTAFQASIDAARDWFEWLVDGLVGQVGVELTGGIDALFPLLERLRPVERELRLRRLAERTGVTFEGIHEEWRRHERSVRRTERLAEPPGSARPPAAPGRSLAPRREGPRDAASSPERQAYRALVGALLADPSLVPLYAGRGEEIPEEGTRAVFEAIVHLHEHGDPEQEITPSAVMTVLGDHPARGLVTDLEELGRRAPDARELAAAQVRWLEARARERELAALREELENVERSRDASPAAREILTNLHRKLRAARVLPSGSPPQGSVPVPSPASSSEA